MARDPHEVLDPEQVADGIFKILDTDGGGNIKSSELRSGLNAIGAGLSDDDLSDVMDLFDIDRSGDIDKREFIQALNTMNTFK